MNIEITGTDDEKLDQIEKIKAQLHSASPLKDQPINRVRWVSIDLVEANSYNPNSVAGKEMGLLHTSIMHDGYTQPIVTIFDPLKERFIIIDGFHRYFTCKNSPELMKRNLGRVPIVVLDKDINDRMASTVRHNRARGEHSIGGMSNLVYKMLKNGWTDSNICNELGMEAEELLKLKHITGFSKLFENKEYGAAWKSKAQIKAENENGVIGIAK